MAAMNKVMDPQKTAATMKEFERQSARMDMTEEMSNLVDSFEILWISFLKTNNKMFVSVRLDDSKQMEDFDVLLR